MPEREHTHDKKARRVARDAVLSMLSADAIADTAAKFGPTAYREVARAESAPARAVALVELAHREGLLEALLAGLPPDTFVDVPPEFAAAQMRLAVLDMSRGFCVQAWRRALGQE